MGQVTEVKVKMMEIAFRSSQNGYLQYKQKRPSSVIMLEDGLKLVQEEDGTVWVRKETEDS